MLSIFSRCALSSSRPFIHSPVLRPDLDNELPGRCLGVSGPTNHRRRRVRALAPPGCRSESVAGDARADAGVGAAGEASRSPYYELAFDTLRLQLEYEAAPAAGEDGGDDRMLCRVVSCRVAGKGNDGAEDAGGDEVGGKRLLFKVCG